MPDAGAVGPVTGEQSAAGRRAGGSDVVVVEGDGLGVELVDVGSLDPGVAIAGEVAVALVVGDDEDDVGLLRWGEEWEASGKEGEDDTLHGGK